MRGQPVEPDPEVLVQIARMEMPFGRYQNRKLHTLPYEYLHWFIERGGGFPAGRLGELMEFVYHTKTAGAEIVFSKIGKR